MKGQTITEEIDGTDYDIKMMGAEEALEAQSILMSIIVKSGMPLDEDISDGQRQLYMMTAMDRVVVGRIKELFENCINAPIIDDDSFSELPPDVIPILFMKIHEHLTAKAIKKKEKPKKRTK